MASLQEQLLKAGVVDQKKAKKIKKEQRKKAKQQPKGSEVHNEDKEQAKQVLADKANKAREENKRLQAEVEKKAIKAQIIQLIKSNAIDRERGEVAYQFSDGKKIKKIYVTELLQTQLSKGLIAIAKLGEAYELVPAVIAEKIQQRDESAIALLNINSAAEAEEDDPYAAYEIPDDLMW